MKRLDEQGPQALVQLPGEPVNKFPEFVRHCVQRLKRLAPTMGKVKIAQTLARAGLPLGATTVGRMLKGGQNAPDPTPAPSDGPAPARTSVRTTRAGSVADGSAHVPLAKQRVVTANYPGHVWHVDLTVVPTGPGMRRFLGSRLPCRSAGLSAFGWPWWSTTSPAARWAAPRQGNNPPRKPYVCSSAAPSAGRAKRPNTSYAIAVPNSHSGGFRGPCNRRAIKPPRYGAVGKHGSIAVVEPLILTLKYLLSCLLLVPYGRKAMQRELDTITD